MSGLLSSIAISVAANIATSLFSKNNTEKEIRTAFQDAIEKWCPNEDIEGLREARKQMFAQMEQKLHESWSSEEDGPVLLSSF